MPTQLTPSRRLPRAAAAIVALLIAVATAGSGVATSVSPDSVAVAQTHAKQTHA